MNSVPFPKIYFSPWGTCTPGYAYAFIFVQCPDRCLPMLCPSVPRLSTWCLTLAIIKCNKNLLTLPPNPGCDPNPKIFELFLVTNFKVCKVYDKNNLCGQARSQDFTLRATEAAAREHFFLKKLTTYFSRRPQNLSSTSQQSQFFRKNPLNPHNWGHDPCPLATPLFVG